MKPIDIICWQTMFGDWEVTNASNFFLTRESNPNKVMTLKREDGFSSFEDCRAFIKNCLQPIPSIDIIHL